MILHSLLIALSTCLQAQMLSMQSGQTGSFTFPISLSTAVSGAQTAQAQVTLPGGISILASSILGPQTIFPGESYTFRVDFQANVNFSNAGPRLPMAVDISYAGSSVTPSAFNWTLSSINGFYTASGSCVDSFGRNCGYFISPDKIAPQTQLAFSSSTYSNTGTIYIASSTFIVLTATDPAITDAVTSGIDLVGYSTAGAVSNFFGLASVAFQLKLDTCLLTV